MTGIPHFATFEDLVEAVAGWEGRRRIEVPLGNLLRRGRHAKGEAALASYIDLFPDAALKQVVGKFSADRLVIGGWDRFHASVRRSRARVAAISFPGQAMDYHGPTDHFFVDEFKPKERVGLLCSFFTDAHPMAGDPEGMTAHLEEHGERWLGDFDEIDVALSLNGAEPLLAAFRKALAWRPERDGEAMKTVCEWWTMFHLHRAVARDLVRLDFGQSLPILVTADSFGDGFPCFYEASGDVHPIDFEAKCPKDTEETCRKLNEDLLEWMKARSRENKRAKKEERAYLDRDGELSAATESMVNMYRAYRKKDIGKMFSEGSGFIKNIREISKKIQQRR